MGKHSMYAALKNIISNLKTLYGYPYVRYWWMVLADKIFNR